jgi:Ni,Fe-hydrogenase maturation factor
MKIKIEGNIYIESDDRQFIAKEYTGKEDKHGTPLFKLIGYYPKIEQAVNAVVDLQIKSSTAETLGDLIKEVKGIRSDIRSKIDF